MGITNVLIDSLQGQIDREYKFTALYTCRRQNIHPRSDTYRYLDVEYDQPLINITSERRKP